MRLNDKDYNFCVALHKELKKKVNGRVFVTIIPSSKKDPSISNMLSITIFMGKNKWRCGFNEFSADEFNQEEIVNQVVDAYHEHVSRTFFK